MQRAVCHLPSIGSAVRALRWRGADLLCERAGNNVRGSLYVRRQQRVSLATGRGNEPVAIHLAGDSRATTSPIHWCGTNALSASLNRKRPSLSSPVCLEPKVCALQV